jgi:hypothetical protein
VEAHAGACDRCEADLRQARAAAARFHAHVFARTLPAVQRRPTTRWRFWIASLGVAAAAAVVLLVVRPPPEGEEPAAAIKGEGGLQIFGRRGEQPLTVREGSALRAGDRIRFAVQPGAARYVCIGSADGRGQANLYYRSTQVGQDGGVVALLPDSVVLDDAPGPERFFAVFSGQPIDDAAVQRALRDVASQGPSGIRRIRRLGLPLAQATVLVEKEAP